MRIQILPLPTVAIGGVVKEPYALVVDQVEGVPDEQALELWQRFGAECGARTVLVVPDTVEIVDRCAGPPVTVNMTDAVIQDADPTAGWPRLDKSQAKPFRACTECGFVYETEDHWKLEYNKAAPRMVMPWPLSKFQAADACPRCLHNF
ncbi:hypothetical protein [Nonomuraea sp. NPDC003804]|uniref:hypothetical protein n=1 Tax=Nonomuraea sp. NPDC003804 TaxID=3154547 RepID=UPI0033B51FF2